MEVSKCGEQRISMLIPSIQYYVPCLMVTITLSKWSVALPDHMRDFKICSDFLISNLTLKNQLNVWDSPSN